MLMFAEKPSTRGQLQRLPAEEGPGILEIKCPYNKGNTTTARPYPEAPFYYMPQVGSFDQHRSSCACKYLVVSDICLK